MVSPGLDLCGIRKRSEKGRGIGFTRAMGRRCRVFFLSGFGEARVYHDPAAAGSLSLRRRASVADCHIKHPHLVETPHTRHLIVRKLSTDRTNFFVLAKKQNGLCELALLPSVRLTDTSCTTQSGQTARQSNKAEKLAEQRAPRSPSAQRRRKAATERPPALIESRPPVLSHKLWAAVLHPRRQPSVQMEGLAWWDRSSLSDSLEDVVEPSLPNEAGSPSAALTDLRLGVLERIEEDVRPILPLNCLAFLALLGFAAVFGARVANFSGWRLFQAIGGFSG